MQVAKLAVPLLALLALATAASAWRPRRSATSTTGERDAVGLSLSRANSDRCHTSVEGEKCFGIVLWQMTNSSGVLAHPEWKANLTKDSSYEEFQAWVHTQKPGVCPRPCPPVRPATGGWSKGGRHESECHTAIKGEACFTSVEWAMSDGMYTHPEWYTRLTTSSEFEDFQAAVHRLDSMICPMPCAKKDRRPCHESSADCETASNASHGFQVPGGAAKGKEEPCHTAVAGDACYKDLQWAMHSGIFLHPEWYDPLTPKSPAVDFQMAIHKRNQTACPAPCGLDASKFGENVSKGFARDNKSCGVAMEGDSCHESVLWAMTSGLKLHPEWYPTLNKTSTFEEVQAVVHKLRPGSCQLPCPCKTARPGDNCYKRIKRATGGRMDSPRVYKAQLELHRRSPSECDNPCQVKAKDTPSLFCFSVVSKNNDQELELIRKQKEVSAGIFACDETAVLSNRIDFSGDMKVLTFRDAAVGVSNANTAANAELFMNAWAAIFHDGEWASYEWVVKADPDAVLLPVRLRRHLSLHTGTKGVYVKNCDRYGSPTMFGSVEAISHSAVKKMLDSGSECRDFLEWKEWGEDVFTSLCMDHIGVSGVYDNKLVGDARCYGADCGDGVMAAYHPFKSVGEWMSCFEQANASWAQETLGAVD